MNVFLKQRRLISILLLGFSSGLPLALVGSTLQAWYAVSGVDIVTIGILSLVGQPYVYKFLWAPFLDRFQISFFGHRRGWILVMQVCLALGIIAMALLNPTVSPFFLAFLALIVAFLSASQDIAIDAYRTDLLPEAERGLGAGLTTVGYRIAMLVSGSIALILAEQLSWRVMFFIMAGLMALGIVVTLWAPKLEIEEQSPSSLFRAFIDPLRELKSRPAMTTILLFIITYKLCDAFALSLGTTFLLKGVGFSLTDVGVIYKVVGMITILLGGVVGGFILPRWGLYRSLFHFGILQAVSNLMFAWLAVVGKSYTLLIAAVSIDNFFGGIASTVFIAFIMGLCHHRYTATQFALFSALAATGRVFIGPIAGLIAKHYGWVEFFICSVLIAIPSLLLLLRMSFVLDFSQANLGFKAYPQSE